MVSLLPEPDSLTYRGRGLSTLTVKIGGMLERWPLLVMVDN